MKLKEVPSGDPGMNNYKYNGKEWQDDLGLNMYAMDMRQYDPAIGRWVVQDPIVHEGQSPYNAFDGNPVMYADPSGGNVFVSNHDFLGRQKYNPFGQFIPMQDRGEGDENYIGESFQQQLAQSEFSEDVVQLKGDAAIALFEYLINPANNCDPPGSDELEIKPDKITEITDVYLAAKQIKMIDARESMTVNDKIGSFGMYAARYSRYSKAIKILGFANDAGTIYNTYSDVDDFEKGRITKERLDYHLAGSVSSIGTSMYVGSEFGGAWGVLGGFLVGSTFSFGELVYDGWNSSVMPVINEGTYNINNGGYSNFHP